MKIIFNSIEEYNEFVFFIKEGEYFPFDVISYNKEQLTITCLMLDLTTMYVN